MRRTRIKICGITQPQDAVAAVEAGADAIGIVLHPASRRCVSLQKAQDIVQAVGPMVATVGLFVDADVEEVRRTADALRLHHLQLHGSESPAYAHQFHDYEIIKAVRVDQLKIRDELQRWRNANLPNLRGLVLETASEKVGGSGIENDWQAIADLIDEGAFDRLPPIIVAGGLTPQNVRQVVKLLRPFAVDVSSGVESSFGEKSMDKIRAFVEEVRAADGAVA